MMKHKVTLALCVLLCCSFIKRDECDFNELLSNALLKIQNYQLVKDYAISQKKDGGKSEVQTFPLVLNSGVKYRFYAVDCPEMDGRLVISIYNNMKRDFLIATTFNSINKSVREGFEFTSSSTSNYCMTLYFTDGKKGRGVGISSYMPGNSRK